MNNKKTILILSITSDIAINFALRKISQGYTVYGTYRQTDKNYHTLLEKGAKLVYLDLQDKKSIHQATQHFLKDDFKWDCMMIAAGAVFPVGPFQEVPIEEWGNSLQINFLGPLSFVHEMLKIRNQNLRQNPAVIFFSGSGTNDAPQNYSAYTLSKIALIKACEVLDAESLDTKFSIIGPGIVDTKIHEPTIASKEKYASSYEKLENAKQLKACTAMDDILECCDWIISQPKAVVGGRNFSVKHDNWRLGLDFENYLKTNDNYLKLRRYGNDNEHIKAKT